MRSRAFLIGSAVLFLIALVSAAAWQAARYYPQAPASLRLAGLLVFAKIAGGAVEAPFRAKRATVYYEDLVGEWLQFGVLAAAAVALHFIAGQIVQEPVAVAPVALGVYGIFCLVRRAA